MDLFLNNKKDITTAARQVSWLGRPVVNRVHISLPWLDRHQQKRNAKRLQFLFNDCGCLWAGPVFLMTFLLLFIPRTSMTDFSWALLGSSLGLAVLAAIIGKFTAMAWSYKELKNWFRQAEQQCTKGN